MTGRLVTSGARTVKNVTGYDLHRLVAGSLGTLGVIVQVALKVRPRPETRRTLHAPGPLETGEALLAAVPGPAGIVATPGEVELRLEGWREEVEEQTEAARAVSPGLEEVDEGAYPSHRPWDEAAVVAEAAVPPSALGALAAEAGERWGALLGVGPALGRPRDLGRRRGRRARAPAGPRRGARRHRPGDPRSRRSRRTAAAGSRRPRASEGIPRPERRARSRAIVGRGLTCPSRTRRRGSSAPRCPRASRFVGSLRLAPRWGPGDAPSDDDLARCVACGLCLPHCPTYRLTGEESASPRGRIAAMRAVAEGHAEVDATFSRFMDACLACRACEDVCPSHVPFGRLMEDARAQVEPLRTGRERRWRRLGLGLLPRRAPPLARGAAPAARTAVRLGTHALADAEAGARRQDPRA